MKKQNKYQEHKFAKKRLLIDFDGVIHRYSKRFNGEGIYDPPMEGAAKGIKTLIDEGYEIVIFTARPNKEEIPKWLDRWDLPQLKITDRKMSALAYIDDRGIRFTSWKDLLNYFC